MALVIGLAGAYGLVIAGTQGWVQAAALVALALLSLGAIWLVWRGFGG